MRTSYKSKAMIIRTKMIPKALYGCELAPVNETALRGLRREVADAISYTTARRSADLTFSVASYGTDLDPDVHIYIRRAQAYRRAYTANENNEKLINTHLGAIREGRQPCHNKGRRPLA